MKNVKALIEINSVINRLFIVKWRLTDQCNYECIYCIRRLKNLHSKLYDNTKSLSTEELCNIAEDISDLVENRCGLNEVKIELIGGEPSILDLHSICKSLMKNNTKVKTIHMTTNLSRDKEYYISLIKLLNDNCINLTITASFHYEYAALEEYFDKANSINNEIKNLHDYKNTINCEIVSGKFNQDTVEKFYNKCKEYELNYKIETDLVHKDGEFIKYKYDGSSLVNNNYIYYKYENDELSFYVGKSNDEETDYIPCKDARYLIIYEDDTTELVSMRNKLFSLKNNLINNDKLNIYTGHRLYLPKDTYYCTSGYGFIDILYDKITSCRYNGPIDIKDFNSIYIKKCNGGYSCSFCGNLSLSKDINLLNPKVIRGE